MRYEKCDDCGKTFSTDKLYVVPNLARGKGYFKNVCDGCERKVRKCLENLKSGTVETVTSPLNKNIINAASTVGSTQENLRKWKRRSSKRSKE